LDSGCGGGSPRSEGFLSEDASIDELDLEALGFSGVAPKATGRPAYHPATLLKIYLPRSRADSASTCSM
jgi:hypothetical protein